MMKLARLLMLFVIMAPLSIFGQSLSITNYDNIVEGDATNSTSLYAYASVKNMSTNDVSVLVKRIDSNYTNLTDNNSICWGICYSPSQSNSTMPILIKAGATDSLSFSGHVNPDKDGIPTEGDITYVFYNAENPSDSSSITVTYKVLDSSLMGYWNFDSLTDGAIKDFSFRSNSGKIFGPKPIKGISHSALEFDGINDYVQIPGTDSPPNEMFSKLGHGSISVWFRCNSIPTEKGISPIFYYGAENPCTDMFDASNHGLIVEVGHSPVHRASRRLYFTIFENSCGYPSFCYDSWDPIETGKWYHFVAVVGKNYNTGYLNGVEMTGRVYNFGSPFDSQFFENAIKHEKMWIGKGYWDGEPMFFDGAIDELRIYNKPLSQSEVTELYNLGTITNISELPLQISFKIYPNPPSEKLFVDFSENDKTNKIIEIYDLSTKIIKRVNDKSARIAIDITGLQKGAYIVKVHDKFGNTYGTRKFIKIQ